MRKRAVSLALCLCMVLSLLPLPALAVGKHPFTDVAATDWFNDSVEYVYEHNLMKGTSDTTFAPYRTTQRGMIVTILHRLEGTPAVASGNPFTDVPRGSNYENAIIWASAKGIVTGYDGITFGPYNDVTRQQMAAILYRYAQMKGYDTSESANLGDYADSSQISNYARTAMAWANGAGLINGNSSKQLMPTGNATRAQTAAILSRFCQNVAFIDGGDTDRGGTDDGKTDTGKTDDTKPPTPDSYTVTFDLNYDDAGIYQTLSVKAGEKITAPTKPIRDNYNFSGWYTDAIKGSKFNFKKAINETTTLYAHWSKINSSGGGSSSGGTGGGGSSYTPVTTYTVTFMSIGSVVSTQTVNSGSPATRPANPVREGYSFGGWYSNDGLTIPYDFNSVVTTNVILYAKWNSANPLPVNFDFGLGDDIIQDLDYTPEEATPTFDTSEEEFVNISTLNDGVIPYTVTDSNGIPNYIDGKFSNKIVSNAEDAISSLNDIHHIMKFENAEQEFEEVTSSSVSLGGTSNHYRLQQIYHNIPVEGYQLIVSTNEAGEITSLNGHYYADLDINTHPSISLDNAKKVIEERFGNIEMRSEGLLIYTTNQETPVLVWKVVSEQNTFYIDSSNGSIVDLESNERKR